MIPRRAVIGALTLAALSPLIANAQHAQQGHQASAPVTPAAKPASGPNQTHAPDSAARPPAAPTGKIGHGDGDLKSALERINQQIKETRAPEIAKRPAPPSLAPRVKLRWRLGLTWPTGLEGQAVPSSEERISLSWR